MACPKVKAQRNFLIVESISETMSVVDLMAKDNLHTQMVHLTLATGSMVSAVVKVVIQRQMVLSMKAALRMTSHMDKAK